MLDTMVFSRWVPFVIESKLLPFLEKFRILKKEPKYGKHRFDFEFIDNSGRILITEVKTTTKVVNDIACFPDAVSLRKLA